MRAFQRFSDVKNGIWVALCIALGFPVVSHAQFTDDFSDFDFANNPTWVGDDSIFDASAGDLHLNGAAISSEAHLSTSCQVINNAVWDFNVRLGFNPSSSNLSRVYIVSDNADLEGPLNGYYVEIGGSPDEVSLYRQDGTSDSLLVDGVDGLVGTTSVNVDIRVTRDALGNWELFADTSAAGGNLVSMGTSFENTYFQSYYVGVFCYYTATRSDQFWYDDFDVTGTAFVDTINPTLTALVLTSNTTLDAYFSEPMLQGPAEVEGNYSADNGLANPSNAVLDGGDASLVHLTFGTAFGNGILNTLTLVNVQDLASNSIGSGSGTFIFFTPDSASYRDVVITELMPDPGPTVGLPESEYIELHNTGNGIFDLDGWSLSDGGSTASLRPYVLLPGEYVIVVANGDSSTFQNNVTSRTMGVSSFPSLNNAGDNITLRDAGGYTVDQVSYTDEWYQNEAKDGGGWSLELINPLLPCTNAFNWIASNHVNGGTPGAQNSVYNTTPDLTAPELMDVLVQYADTIELVFSESVDSIGALNATYLISPTLTISDVLPVGPSFERVLLAFSTPLVAGVVHTISVTGIADCSGNIIATGTDQFALPQQAEAGDIIVNEVLFDPPTSGSDFVEIYNNSDKIVSLKDWGLANYDDDTISNFKEITAEPFLFFPGEYVVLTTDVSWVRSQYFGAATVDRFIEMESVPTYSNDSATVYLINNLDTVSDGFSYDEDMHFALLNVTESVSLERLDFDRESNDATNWHSAAENVDFATPGYENSQYYPSSGSGEISIDPEVFSPNNDGNADVVNINYSFAQPGFVGNLVIYDSKGRIIRHLARSELLSSEGTISWDGTNEGREKARVGIYVIYFEVFDLDGNVSKFKETCVLATQF